MSRTPFLMEDLPEEVLERICWNFKHSGTKSAGEEDTIKRYALLDLCLSSKRNYRVAHSVLFHTLDLKTAGLQSIRSLLSVLIEKPETCKFVTQLHVPTWETQTHHDNGNSMTSPPPSALVTRLSAAARDLDVSANIRQMLEDGLRRGVEDAEVALLLGMCTRLKLLDIHSVHRLEHSLVSAVMRDQVRSFELLREVRVQHWDTEGSTAFGALVPFLSLPALRDLQGNAVSCLNDERIPDSLASAVNRVDLKFSLMDAVGLDRLFSACPAIDTLSIHWGSATVGMSNIDYDTFGESLRRRGSRLRILRLDLTLAESVEDSQGRLGSLKNLTSLRVLEIPFDAVFGDEEDSDATDSYLLDVFPRSLKTLKFSRANEDYDMELHDSQISAMMNDDTFKDLTTIRLEREESFTSDLTSSGWDSSKSNQCWVVLKRA